MSRFHEMDEQQDVVDYEDDYEEDIDDDEDAVGEEGELAEAVEGGNSDSSADDLEPDSLAENGLPVAQTGADSSDSDTVQISGEDADVEAATAADGGDHEIEEVFSRDANSNPVSRMSAASAVLPLSRSGGGSSSRAESIMSRSSISYFVDLQQEQQQRDDASSSPGPSPAVSSCPSVATALSKSMYATRSVSRESQGSVSFFVDISENESNSRGSPFTAKPSGVARNSAVAAPPHHTRRRQSIGDSRSTADEPVALITRTREHLKLTMTGPTLTKSEVRRKKLAVSKMEALLSEEEARLRRGEEPSNVNIVDVVLCDGSDQSRTGGGVAAPNRFHLQQLDQDTRQRPLSAYQQQRHAERNSACENQVRTRVCVIQSPDSRQPFLPR